MPSIAKRRSNTAAVNDSIPLPSKFPEIPGVVVERFPEMDQWKKDVSLWWKKTNAAIVDFNRDGSTVINQTYNNAENLKVSVNGLTAQITEINEVIITNEEAFARRNVTVSAMAGISSNITVASTPPGSPLTNDYWIDTSTPAIPITYRWTGSAWSEVLIPISSAGVATEQTARIAAVSSEQTARINADNVLSSSISTVSAALSTETTNRIAAVSSEQTARINADNTLASDITTVSAAVSTETTNRIAAVSSEQTARINADNTLASDITTVSAAVSTETTNRIAAVSTEATARATADGFLSGKYTLTVTAGDVVTGMNITSSTGSGTNVSSVIFRATDFKIYNSVSGVAMFSVSGTAIKLGDTLTVDTVNSKVYIGTGTFAGATTSFYVDSAGQFSLKDKFQWNGTTLTLTGTVTATAGNIGGFTISASNLVAGTGTSRLALANVADPSPYYGEAIIQIGDNTTYFSVLDKKFLKLSYLTGSSGIAHPAATLSAYDATVTSDNCGNLDLSLAGTTRIFLSAFNGTGDFDGLVSAAGFEASGSTGIGGTITLASITTITVVGGIITAWA
jgi:hypothetical protein